MIYARQFWGSTKRSYPFSRGKSPLSKGEIDGICARVQAALDEKLARAERPPS